MIKRYIAFECNFFINRIQLILSLYLLLRLLSCNSLLSNDCLHCLKTSTNLFNSITLSNISYESTSVIQSFFFFFLFILLKMPSTKKDVRQLLSAINNIKLIKLIEQQLRVIQARYEALAI